MPSNTPLTDAIEALTRYANETTGASDTTLSDAVGTLVAGYGGGGFGTVLKTHSVTESVSDITLTLTASEIAEYPVIFAFYDLTLSTRDFIYYNIDTTTKDEAGRKYDTAVVEHTGAQGLMLSLPYYNTSGTMTKPSAFLYFRPWKDAAGYASYSMTVVAQDNADHTLNWMPERATTSISSGKITVVGYKYTSL